MECVGQNLDQLAEIHTFVGYIIEDCLVAVALILHVTNLHLQSQVLCYLSALNHCGVLAPLSLAAFVQVGLARYTVYAPYLVGRLQIGFLYLHLHEPSRERHHTDVVSRISFYSHNVALLQVKTVHIVVVTLAGVLELHLNQVGAELVSRHVGQPVVCVQLAVLPSHGVLAQASVLAAICFKILVVIIHVGRFAC